AAPSMFIEIFDPFWDEPYIFEWYKFVEAVRNDKYLVLRGLFLRKLPQTKKEARDLRATESEQPFRILGVSAMNFLNELCCAKGI
ncbi:hypothetical protein AB6A40_011654, partial [Gnathostoma spinigerum]